MYETVFCDINLPIKQALFINLPKRPGANKWTDDESPDAFDLKGKWPQWRFDTRGTW